MDILKYQTELLQLREKYIFLPQSKPKRLTIPAIFNRSYEENFISDYLAYILNPKINGIGVEPLQTLLSLKFPDVPYIDPDGVEIKREYVFKDNESGRIDLLITIGENYVVGIENKITSWEGENQTISYRTGIEREYGNRTLYMIFLSPQGQKPSSPGFLSLSYAEIFHAFRPITFPALQDIHKFVIWEDFLAHLQEYLIMENGEMAIAPKTNLYLEHREMIEDLLSSFRQDAQKLYDYVLSSAQQRFKEGWQAYGRPNDPSHYWVKDSWRLIDSYVFFQFNFRRDDLILGQTFSYMLGAYPIKPDSQKFINFLAANYQEIIEKCAQRGISTFRDNEKRFGNLIIAFKDYPINRDDLASFDQQFLIAIDEFSFLEPIIDKALSEFKQV